VFSNNLIKSMCKSSDERNLRLSKEDWEIVLNANKNFTESEEEFRGDSLWGNYLFLKIGVNSQLFQRSPSLELCSGNGFLYFSLKKYLSNKIGDNYFIDISMNQCNQFEKRCRKEEENNNRIICGDIGQLPFKDEYFQLVYGNSFLHHLPDVLVYLKEVNRVLPKGGVFVVFHEPTLTAPFFEAFPLSLAKDTRSDSLTDIWNISPEVITHLLQEAGFSKINIKPVGIISSIIVTPLQIMANKISTGKGNLSIFVRLKIICDYLDRFIPESIRLRISPSLAIISEK